MRMLRLLRLIRLMTLSMILNADDEGGRDGGREGERERAVAILLPFHLVHGASILAWKQADRAQSFFDVHSTQEAIV